MQIDTEPVIKLPLEDVLINQYSTMSVMSIISSR